MSKRQKLSAGSLMDDGDFKSALPLLIDEYQNNRYLYETSYNLGRCYVKLQKYDLAIKYLNVCRCYNPTRAEPFMLTAKAYLHQSKYSEAVAILKMAKDVCQDKQSITKMSVAVRDKIKAAKVKINTLVQITKYCENPDLLSLPPEIIGHVMSYLTLKEKVQCLEVCYKWKNYLSKDGSLWTSMILPMKIKPNQVKLLFSKFNLAFLRKLTVLCELKTFVKSVTNEDLTRVTSLTLADVQEESLAPCLKMFMSVPEEPVSSSLTYLSLSYVDAMGDSYLEPLKLCVNISYLYLALHDFYSQKLLLDLNLPHLKTVGLLVQCPRAVQIRNYCVLSNNQQLYRFIVHLSTIAEDFSIKISNALVHDLTYNILLGNQSFRRIMIHGGIYVEHPRSIPDIRENLLAQSKLEDLSITTDNIFSDPESLFENLVSKLRTFRYAGYFGAPLHVTGAVTFELRTLILSDCGGYGYEADMLILLMRKCPYLIELRLDLCKCLNDGNCRLFVESLSKTVQKVSFEYIDSLSVISPFVLLPNLSSLTFINCERVSGEAVKSLQAAFGDRCKVTAIWN